MDFSFIISVLFLSDRYMYLWYLYVLWNLIIKKLICDVFLRSKNGLDYYYGNCDGINY